MTDFTRRSVMIGAGSLAAGLAVGIPQPPAIAAPIDTASPLILTQHGDTAYLLRIRCDFPEEALKPYNIATYYNGKEGVSHRRIKLQLTKMDKGIPVSSVIDAENLIISKASVAHEAWLPDPSANYLTDFTNGPAFFSFGLRRQAAYLCCQNRRGWPSGTLMHPSMAEKLIVDQHWIPEHEYKPVPGPKIGRWNAVGILQKCGVAYTNETIPENEAILFYNRNTYGSFDWPAMNTTDSAAVFFA